MNHYQPHPARRVADDTYCLECWIPVPGYGVLPVNAYVIKAGEPVLVDTGLAATRELFLAQLESIIDPADLRWIWLTHVDADHVGNLAAVLERAPQARVITTWLGMGKMGMIGLPLERVHLVNPGQRLRVGDRSLLALRPPVFDAPETTGLLDEKSGTCFSSDCFGAVLPDAACRANDIEASLLEQGVVTWTGIDAPWLHTVNVLQFEKSLKAFSAMAADVVLGSHLPPAVSMNERLLELLYQAAIAEPFIGPDQAMLERMVANG